MRRSSPTSCARRSRPGRNALLSRPTAGSSAPPQPTALDVEDQRAPQAPAAHHAHPRPHLEASTHHRLQTNAGIFDNRALDVAGRGTHGPNQADSEMRRRYEQLRDQRNAVVRQTEQRIASLPFTSHRVQNGSTSGILVNCCNQLVHVDDFFDNDALDGSVLGYTRLRLDETQARAELAAGPPVSDEKRKHASW